MENNSNFLITTEAVCKILQVFLVLYIIIEQRVNWSIID